MRVFVCEDCGEKGMCRNKGKRFCDACRRLHAKKAVLLSKQKDRAHTRHLALLRRHKRIGDPNPVITFDEMITLWSKNCVYCGRPGGSIDRISSLQGYSLINTQPTCLRCNLMKWSDEESTFLDYVKSIYEFRNLK